jgi:hypothetical protein
MHISFLGDRFDYLCLSRKDYSYLNIHIFFLGKEGDIYCAYASLHTAQNMPILVLQLLLGWRFYCTNALQCRHNEALRTVLGQICYRLGGPLSWLFYPQLHVFSCFLVSISVGPTDSLSHLPPPWFPSSLILKGDWMTMLHLLELLPSWLGLLTLPVPEDKNSLYACCKGCSGDLNFSNLLVWTGKYTISLM